GGAASTVAKVISDADGCRSSGVSIGSDHIAGAWDDAASGTTSAVGAGVDAWIDDPAHCPAAFVWTGSAKISSATAGVESGGSTAGAAAVADCCPMRSRNQSTGGG